MVNLTAVFIGNGSAVLLLFILIVASAKTIQNKLPDNNLFLTMVFCAIFQSITETLTFVFDGKPGSFMHILLLILNSLLFINNILFTFTWTLYADYKLFSDIKRIKKIYSFLAIPALLVILGSVISLFYPLFYSISAGNIYQRGKYYIIPYAITYFYLTYGVVLIYKNRYKGRRYLFLPAIQFIFPIVIGSIFQFFIYGISVIWICSAIALCSVYINLQNEVVYTDPISGMFTRQYLNRFLDVEIHKPGQKKIFSGIMLDIDRFKSINDTYGHLTGDDAIRSAGIILHSCVSYPNFICRFAGDEFIIILFTENQSETEALIKKIKDRTDEFNSSKYKPYSVNFSMGYSIFDFKKDTTMNFINRMDHAMYEDKKKKTLYPDVSQTI